MALSINKAQYLPHMRHVDADYAIYPESRFCLLSCSTQNMQITLTPAHFLDTVPELRFHNVQLVPNSLMAFTNISMRKTDPCQSPSCLTNLAGPTEVHEICGTSGEPLPMSLPLCFSPSGQLVCDSHPTYHLPADWEVCMEVGHTWGPLLDQKHVQELATFWTRGRLSGQQQRMHQCCSCSDVLMMRHNPIPMPAIEAIILALVVLG